MSTRWQRAGMFVVAVAVVAGAAMASQPRYRVVHDMPHDSAAFTQGLVYRDGVFFEGTGLYGESTLRRVEASSGIVLQHTALPQHLFGEGITVLGDKIYQLTWKARRGFVYDLASFERLQSFSYESEGWGLTDDGSRLIMSDGTDRLSFIDPESFEVLGSVRVRDEHGSVDRLNELEFVNGHIFANVYQTNRIVVINPVDGVVVRTLDLEALTESQRMINRDAGVLNGIAHDRAEDRLFVTGKRWSRIYALELMP